MFAMTNRPEARTREGAILLAVLLLLASCGDGITTTCDATVRNMIYVPETWQDRGLCAVTFETPTGDVVATSHDARRLMERLREGDRVRLIYWQSTLESDHFHIKSAVREP